ncbi:fructosamine kinase family protein [cf. Phormidesmis sp. LEGE 11477]|uniref:fructosamine kinase family protein n=1 Tax=cf. Phormidesmis sp. LEGE 11477 TaxID=1828680 RepID=UPI001882B372|nr:fructosamine kinase family protein [cf. Phormidesmis sp. LEGE 11477]MBE9059560.1 fructosamine kinase family protein [cf. Phormidesmis sp. LEGE 11477]
MATLGGSVADRIAEHISEVTGSPFQIAAQRSVGGGCINQAAKVSGRNRTFFIKTNHVDQLAMFEAERDGLQEMYDSRSIRVPQPLCCGVAGTLSYIVMEWLDLGGGRSGSAWRQMGEQLAAMHRATSDHGYGWHRDNTIGSTPQQNQWCEDWVEFWRDRRLGPQFSLAHAKGGHFSRRDELMNAIPKLLRGHTPTASLLHGDLWSGNAAITAEGEPVILDPATYYGDPEADLAMTELFGRFPNEFYQAYDSVLPIDDGYRQRQVLYNLYHILNHFNLFGGSYESQANSMINQLLP